MAQLPTEVASRVADHLDSYDDLTALNATSRRWRTAARPLLWRQLVIDGSNNSVDWAKAVRQCQFLIANPNLLEHVRDLAFYGDEGAGLCALLFSLLTLCLPYLHALEIQHQALDHHLLFLICVNGRRLDRVVLGPAYNAHDLSVLRPPGAENAVDAIVSISTQLKLSELAANLHISSRTPSFVDARCTLHSGTILHKLLDCRRSRGTAAVISNEALQSLATNSARWLEIRDAAGWGRAWNPLVNLRRLHVVRCVCKANAISFPKQLEQVLRFATGLQDLILEAPTLRHWHLNETAEVFAVASSSLTRLHLDIESSEPAGASQALDSLVTSLATNLPLLQLLDLHFTSFELVMAPEYSATLNISWAAALKGFHRLHHFGTNLLPVPIDMGAPEVWLSTSFEVIARNSVDSAVPGPEATAEERQAYDDALALDMKSTQAIYAQHAYLVGHRCCPWLRSFALPLKTPPQMAALTYLIKPWPVQNDGMPILDIERVDETEAAIGKTLRSELPLPTDVVEALRLERDLQLACGLG